MMRPLLIPLTYFCLQTWLGIPQAKCQVELSMMDDAFDDQYMGCAEKMDEIAPGLLGNETSMSSLFSTVWEKSKQKWELVKKESLPPNFKDEYGRAIVAYTDNTTGNSSTTFSTIFNDAVSGTKRSRTDYMDHFQFKAFHYYLTRALQLLIKTLNVTYNMMLYRGTKSQYRGSGLIRFGYFASSSINKQVAETFGTDTLFTIHTSFGVKIWNFSYSPSQEEVLIPVHETFSVSLGKESNSFVLRSTNRTCRHFNCAYLGGEYWAEQRLQRETVLVGSS
ncbi:LOW QUALITY PROTEIN: ecto-ADP-ribosyltransferase 5-like [Macrochelys suwanniensis]